eukprot:SM000196S05353  [mRNA]  locus=s196:6689:11005:+ [translate_table: standard]
MAVAGGMTPSTSSASGARQAPGCLRASYRLRGFPSSNGSSLSIATSSSVRILPQWCSLPAGIRISAFAKQTGQRRKGFGKEVVKKDVKEKGAPTRGKEDWNASAQRVLEGQQQQASEPLQLAGPGQAPDLLRDADVLENVAVPEDRTFEERLAALKSSVAEKEKTATSQVFAPIDYDAPPSMTSSDAGWTENLGAKIGIGVAATFFGLLFAFGDILPSQVPQRDLGPAETKLTDAEKATLQDLRLTTFLAWQEQLARYKAMLAISSTDAEGLEGAAVSSAELGDYTKAAEYLTELTKMKPDDPEALRLLAEVRSAQKDYKASADTYRQAAKASTGESIVLLRGLTDSLLADGRPQDVSQLDKMILLYLDSALKLNLGFQVFGKFPEKLIAGTLTPINPQAVGELLATRARLRAQLSTQDESSTKPAAEKFDTVQLGLLLGKAYSAWGKAGDAAAVYDGLIVSKPEDFRGYLAKGVLLKEQGKKGDAERMFVQARFLAPEQAKGFVDRLSGREIFQ